MCLPSSLSLYQERYASSRKWDDTDDTLLLALHTQWSGNWEQIVSHFNKQPVRFGSISFPRIHTLFLFLPHSSRSPSFSLFLSPSFCLLSRFLSFLFSHYLTLFLSALLSLCFFLSASFSLPHTHTYTHIHTCLSCSRLLPQGEGRTRTKKAMQHRFSTLQRARRASETFAAPHPAAAGQLNGFSSVRFFFGLFLSPPPHTSPNEVCCYLMAIGG